MEQYISKSAIVAEINKRLHQLTDAAFDSMIGRNLIEIKDFLDTLEVKEVDLEKELDTWRHNHFHGRRDKDASGEYLERSSQLDLAKHFFVLGTETQKEDNNEL